MTFRVRQIIKERQSYSKSKHRELAKLLREGNRDEFARIKTEDVIANDDLIRALEILELTCEQLSVRVNLLDYLAFGRGKRPTSHRRKGSQDAKRQSAAAEQGQGGGWGLWKMFGFGGSSATSTSEQTHPVNQQKDREERDTYRTKTEGNEEEEETYIEPELDRCAAIIFYAYPRLPRDVPGLPELRAKLALRWGNDFANRAQEDDPPVRISDELVERLQVQRPPAALVDMYLKEIARSHEIPWHKGEGEGEDEGEDEVKGVNGGGNAAQKQEHRDAPTNSANDPPPSQSKGTAGLGDSKTLPSVSAGEPEPDMTPQQASGGIPEVDELAKRFAALKR